MLYPFIYISYHCNFLNAPPPQVTLKVLLDVFHIQYVNIEATLHV